MCIIYRLKVSNTLHGYFTNEPFIMLLCVKPFKRLAFPKLATSCIKSRLLPSPIIRERDASDTINPNHVLQYFNPESYTPRIVSQIQQFSTEQHSYEMPHHTHDSLKQAIPYPQVHRAARECLYGIVTSQHAHTLYEYEPPTSLYSSLLKRLNRCFHYFPQCILKSRYHQSLNPRTYTKNLCARACRPHISANM